MIPEEFAKSLKMDLGHTPKALLVAIYRGTPNKEICEEHLDELAFLSQTYGLEAIYRAAVPVRKIDAATFIGKGKVDELVEIAKENQANLIIFDDEITPAQQRNLEKIFSCRVMDRTELILEVFAQRAQTKEARLQTELARVKYQYPRLKRMWTHLERQSVGGGTGAYLKGAGEKQIEIDKQLLKTRIERLQQEIKDVIGTRETQRLARQRAKIPVFAIIGYTNAGKSTLLNALTGANVFVEDKLFATLDTTTRKFNLPNNQEILIIDTVGFIRKLPHLLVAAFKSTLEEAIQADILLHIVDVSHPMAEEQAETSFEVLKELNAENKPVITLLNKIDKAPRTGMVQKLRLKYPHTISISAINQTGFDELQEAMIQELSKQRKIVTMRIPQKDYAIVSEVIRQGNVLKTEYEDNDVVLKAELPIDHLGRLKKYLEE